MAGTVELRRDHRPLTEVRAWTGSRLADAARVEAPDVRRVVRELDDPGAGTEIQLRAGEDTTWATVTRLWLGVLAIFMLIVLVGLTVIVLGAWAFGYRPVVVTSGSMTPVVRTGDIVITRPVGMDDEVGDQTVIDYIDPVTGERRLHRVIEVTDAGYRTKGDANEDPDAALVPQDHVEGAGFIVAPFIGYLPVWVQEREWPQVAAATTVLVVLAAMSRRRFMWGRSR